MIVEHVDFISVPTRDVPRAKHFYGELLGLEHEKDTPAGAEYRAGQVTLAIWSPESQGMEFARNPAGFALRVPDVAEAKAALEAAGVTVNDVWDSGVCRGAGFSDPAGNRLLLHRRYKGYEQS